MLLYYGIFIRGVTMITNLYAERNLGLNVDDRRMYQRFESKKSISLFFNGKEYQGQLSDVSEYGVGVILKEEIPVNKSIQYQFIYNCKLSNGSEHMNIVSGIGSIVRNSPKNGKNFLGCRLLPNESLSAYIRSLMCQTAC